ncbi:ImmA/IrrE family metallo-endopeptidase [Bacillus haynesii]|uniref:ImmA/IrrE family metallo-endopeptidase n=1 Tax=Bacillus haynesii TaxID=1925021 RepID=UPI0022805258|nr:ImmA/IrrE family metallo-endopeptidase [Bacillus haynesii]MCY8344992.1 ImmA/IrrE family metallo-endopeptidase [Bacillus haynesii]MCY8409019.1 ImmA/IrrE family metallo-endopeptidase [Bacillus haynesii]MCY8433432.1 ImmA/IrrE family metallo-endopeptidase [Bacillus haynesii]MCY8557888.1 ImmA/IrrE family metallo-endopeptidase [Bacillus haynesii]
MVYTNSHLEDWIENLYMEINITQPDQINFENIADALGIEVVFKPAPSFSFKYDNVYTISLDKRKTRRDQWDDFAHELCHLYRHEGDKNIMPKHWINYQECQAIYFSYHFCIPTFMLQKLKMTHNLYYDALLIAKTFKVTESFATTRLNMYFNKIRLIV